MSRPFESTLPQQQVVRHSRYNVLVDTELAKLIERVNSALSHGRWQVVGPAVFDWNMGVWYQTLAG